jgi:hypothetical protein
MAKRRCKVSPLIATPSELKRLWIRVLKRLHPDLVIHEKAPDRSDGFTQQANDANARRDEFALRVLEPKGPVPPTNHPPLTPEQAPSTAGPEAVGILWAACAVVCLLLYVIVDVLREAVGRSTSLCFLVLLTATVLWWITKNSKLSYSHKAKWVAAVASGMILVGISLLDSRPGTNPLFQSARAATAQAQAPPVALKDSLHPGNAPQMKATVMPPRPESGMSLGAQLSGYIEAAKSQVAQKWNSAEVAGTTPAGATVYIQFAIRRRGTHEVPTMETSSGYPSLDASCLRAVERIRNFDHLPNRYSGDSLIVLYHCTYPGSPTTTLAQDSSTPPVQQPPAHGPVDAVHGVQQPTKDTVVNN